ncbi:hypothetical protein IW261DRAFT_1422629 [Armillaria novae-zelandiae]|uniref:FAD-binding PCMH-type domain-containing protein n=1 Tax=Armillaria novae-zelandiae TaxID=153914 RepID=A0AA39P0I3_9AGAR|nr:hypothetical protein IW261DRAFT_1422629 [Armillaria novae-zelandiae]
MAKERQSIMKQKKHARDEGLYDNATYVHKEEDEVLKDENVEQLHIYFIQLSYKHAAGICVLEASGFNDHVLLDIHQGRPIQEPSEGCLLGYKAPCLLVYNVGISNGFLQSIFSASATPTTTEWLNSAHSVDGRLHGALPFAYSCFSTVNGASSAPDAGECSQVQADYTNATVRSEHFSAYMLPQWEMCQKTSERCLLDPSNTSNPMAFVEGDCLQGSVPPRYIDVQSAEDVQKAFEFSKATGVHLSIKASGHDYKGRSSLRSSLSLWTRNLDDLKYSTDFIPEGGNRGYRAITMGAGVPFKDVYEFADANNVTIIGAYHQTVAPSGGWVMTKLQFKIVTPNGELRVSAQAIKYSYPNQR